jgi:fructose transport system permease protein
MDVAARAGQDAAGPAEERRGGPPDTKSDTNSNTQPSTGPARLLRVLGEARLALRHYLHRHPSAGPMIVLVLSVAIFDLLNPRLLYAEDISLMLQQLAVLGCLAIGQTIIMLTAGIDLSVGAAMILAQMVMAELAVTVGLPAALALVIGIAFGAATGAINGGLVARLGLPPFIVTLGTLGVYTAVGLLLSGGTTIFFSNPHDLLLWTGRAVSIGPFNMTSGVFVMLGLYLLLAYMLSRTAWGRHVYAVGDSPEASQLSGVRVRSVLLSVYVLAGILYGIGAWIQIGRVGNASTNISSTLNLDSITAVVIGGTSLFGGRGVVIGTLVGAMIVQVFQTGLALAGVQSLYLELAEGLLVIGAVTVDHWIRAAKAHGGR